jgi:hypothetical protein
MLNIYHPSGCHIERLSFFWMSHISSLLNVYHPSGCSHISSVLNIYHPSGLSFMSLVDVAMRLFPLPTTVLYVHMSFSSSLEMKRRNTYVNVLLVSALPLSLLSLSLAEFWRSRAPAHL